MKMRKLCEAIAVRQQDLSLIRFSRCRLISLSLFCLNCLVFGVFVNRILLQFHGFAGLRAFLLQTFVPDSGFMRILLSHHDGSDVLLWLELSCKSIPTGVDCISFCNARRDNREGKNVNNDVCALS